jgi:HEAT repeat protein
MLRSRSSTSILVALTLAATVAACRPSATAPLEFQPVVADNVKRLESAIGPEPTVAKADPDLVDRARELVARVAGQTGAFRASSVTQAHALGDPIVPVLSGWLGDHAQGADARRAAIEVLAGVDTPRAEHALLYQARENPEVWVRSNCAWRLGDTQQDQCVIPLLDAMRDERDADVQGSIGTALARFGCYAFWPPKTRDDAALAREVARRWRFNDLTTSKGGAEFIVATPSDRAKLEVWRRLAALHGADRDSRERTIAVLGDLPAYAADILGAALRDTDVEVRGGAARALARMEMRGAAAGPTLHESLLRDAAVTVEALEALGAVHEEAAAQDIARYLGADHPIEQRVAAARALGRLADGRTLAALQSALKIHEPTELRTAAAIALLAFGREKEAFPVLDEAMSSTAADVSAVETAVADWLQARAAHNDERAQAWLQKWMDPSATRATRTKLLHDEIVPSLR